MKSKIKVLALAGILAVVGIGGTFAYFNQTDKAINTFNTGTYEMELVEDFKPKEGENWEPGSFVNKDVLVKNQGTLPVVVRVKFKETWVTRDDAKRMLYEMDSEEVAKASAGAATTSNALTAGEKGILDPNASEEVKNKFESVYQGDPNDGRTGQERDDSVVHKTMDPDSKWVYNPRDGYYYYTEVLPGKKEGEDAPATTMILDGVRLDENTDMGAFTERKYYQLVGSDEWVEFDKDPNTESGYVAIDTLVDRLNAENKEIAHMKATPYLDEEGDVELSGYRNADYILTITAHTVQATDGAVASIFQLDRDAQKALGCNWNLLNEDDIFFGDSTPSNAESGTGSEKETETPQPTSSQGGN